MSAINFDEAPRTIFFSLRTPAVKSARLSDALGCIAVARAAATANPKTPNNILNSKSDKTLSLIRNSSARSDQNPVVGKNEYLSMSSQNSYPSYLCGARYGMNSACKSAAWKLILFILRKS